MLKSTSKIHTYSHILTRTHVFLATNDWFQTHHSLNQKDGSRFPLHHTVRLATNLKRSWTDLVFCPIQTPNTALPLRQIVERKNLSRNQKPAYFPNYVGQLSPAKKSHQLDFLPVNRSHISLVGPGIQLQNDRLYSWAIMSCSSQNV